MGFIIKRVFIAIPTLWVLITISFFIVYSAPGSPFLTEAKLPPKVLENIEKEYNLDKPLYVQYFIYLKNILRFDFGPSFKYRNYSVTYLIKQAIPISLTIGLISFLTALSIGLICGVVAGSNQNSWIDYTVMFFAMLGIAVPNFVLAPLLVLSFAIYFKVFPAGGWGDGHVMYLVLPVFAMCFRYIATIARITRGSLIEVLNSNFIKTARAKGLSKTYIVFVHAIKPTILPVVSYLGPAFVGIVTGSVVIEQIFGLPGIGNLFVNGALNRDYSMVLAITILIGAMIIFFNMLVDIMYALLDPKIRL